MSDWGISQKTIEQWSKKRKSQTERDDRKDQKNQLLSASETIAKWIKIERKKCFHWQRVKDFGADCM